MGQLLALASSRFDARVLSAMAHDDELSLALANLAGRGVLTASHIHITRHLPREGCRLTELAYRAGISKQAMGKLVDSCCAWNLVRKVADPRDARAVRIEFTVSGLQWLRAYQQGVEQAHRELTTALGPPVATVLQLGLEAYIS
ncbi:MAG: MarR family transcriptional regulator [Rhodoferax sp.]|nr:MarR family transcriptional regulator [Rhodoferax sp.]